jgi:hypothetical protein
MVGFFHPKLDSLGIEAPVRRATMVSDATQGIDLAVPSPLTVVAALCGRRAALDSSGFVAGYVLRPDDGRTREGARIVARWSEIIISRGGTRASTREADAVTGPGGWFGLCGVPRGALILARVTAEADTGSFVELELPDHGVLLRALYLADQRPAVDNPPLPGSGAPAGGSDAAATRTDSSITGRAPAARDRRGRLRGLVQNQFGEPVPGARVSIWGSLLASTTNQDGAYVIGDILPGTHTLEVRAIGFVPSRQAIDVFAQQPGQVDVHMTDFPTEIDTVRVLARRPLLATEPGSFEHRRRLGYGTFLDADQIERRLPQQFSDLLRATRGVQVATTGVASAQVLMEGSNPTVACEPLLVLDGQRVPLNGMNINDLIPPYVVRAVEIYPRRMEAPPEFQTSDCGTIVVWTGPRGWLAKRGKATPPRGKRKT